MGIKTHQQQEYKLELNIYYQATICEIELKIYIPSTSVKIELRYVTIFDKIGQTA